MTLTLFNKLDKQRKDLFDMEMRLTRANMTYEESYIKANEEEEWLH